MGEDSLDPFPKVLVQGAEQQDSRQKLHHKEGQGQVQVQYSDGVFVVYVGGKVNEEGYGQSDEQSKDSCGMD